MNIFLFLYLLGIINIVFGFLWKWIFVLPIAFLFTALKIDRAILVVKAFGAYLLISLTALITLLALKNIENWWQLLVFPAIWAFVLFLWFASNAYEQSKQSHMNHYNNYINETKDDSWFDVLLMIVSIILFILILFIPAISQNTLNWWLLNTIMRVYKLPFIGRIVGIGGVIFMINILFHWLLMLLMLGASIYKLFKNTKNIE